MLQVTSFVSYLWHLRVFPQPYIRLHPRTSRTTTIHDVVLTSKRRLDRLVYYDRAIKISSPNCWQKRTLRKAIRTPLGFLILIALVMHKKWTFWVIFTQPRFPKALTQNGNLFLIFCFGKFIVFSMRNGYKNKRKCRSDMKNEKQHPKLLQTRQCNEHFNVL